MLRSGYMLAALVSDLTSRPTSYSNKPASHPDDTGPRVQLQAAKGLEGARTQGIQEQLTLSFALNMPGSLDQAGTPHKTTIPLSFKDTIWGGHS